MSEIETHDPQDMPPDFVGYMRCCDCGVQILSSWGKQTGRRCIDCWKDHHPLATLEVINRGVRMSARSLNNGSQKTTPKKIPDAERFNRKARQAAARRLATIFPDIYAMLLDEERAEFGLAPLARYEPVDFDATASKTLGFEAVYDALESRGVSDE